MYKRPTQRTCASSSALQLDASSACTPIPRSKSAAIDEYYEATKGLVTLGTEAALNNSQDLGRLLLLGHISAVETYFRSILVRLLDICDQCRSNAGGEALNLSSIYYYSRSEIAYGLFDGASLAGKAAFRKAMTRATGYQLNEKSPAAIVLASFDKLCHLRHAAVHSHGAVSSQSAAALGMSQDSNRLQVVVDFALSQQIAQICRATVQEVNQFLYEETVLGWRKSERLTGIYENDRKDFEILFRSFRSKADFVSSGLRPKDAYSDAIR